MKRRDFVLKMSLIFIPSSIQKLSTRFIPTNPINNTERNTYTIENIQTICQPGTFCLPKNPEIISSVYFIDIKKSDKVQFKSDFHKINRQKQLLEIKGPGKYTAQYLGPDYGWNII